MLNLTTIQEALATNTQWYESALMYLKIDKTTMDKYITAFMNQANVIQNTYSITWDVQKHFLNWVRIQIEKATEKPKYNKPKPSGTLVSPEKWMLFEKHIKTFKIIPKNPDWLTLYDYLTQKGKVSPMEVKNYSESVKIAKERIIEYVGNNYTLVSEEAYKMTDIKGKNTLGEILRKSLER